MMAATTNKDLETQVNELDKKVDSLAQRQDEVLIPGIQDIKKQMENFAYVSQKEYADDKSKFLEEKKKIIDRIKALEDFKTKYEPSIDTGNKVFTGVGKIILYAFIVGIVGVIAVNLYKVVPALGGIAQ